jgi:hypothetical protein
MYQPREYRSSLILAAAVAGAGLMSGASPVASRLWSQGRGITGTRATPPVRYVLDQHAYRAAETLSE